MIIIAMSVMIVFKTISEKKMLQWQCHLDGCIYIGSSHVSTFCDQILSHIKASKWMLLTPSLEQSKSVTVMVWMIWQRYSNTIQWSVWIQIIIVQSNHILMQFFQSYLRSSWSIIRCGGSGWVWSSIAKNMIQNEWIKIIALSIQVD